MRGRREADPNEVFLNLPNLFGSFYSNAPDDHVGHPNAAGYDILARLFFNVIQGIDTVSPVPGIISPVDGATNVKPDATILVDVWDFGAGIDLANTFLLVNGQPVTATPQGTAQHASLTYQSPTPLSGTVTVGLRSRDLATPPNSIDRQIASFTIQGADQRRSRGTSTATAAWTAPTSSSSASTSEPCAARPLQRRGRLQQRRPDRRPRPGDPVGELRAVEAVGLGPPLPRLGLKPQAPEYPPLRGGPSLPRPLSPGLPPFPTGERSG